MMNTKKFRVCNAVGNALQGLAVLSMFLFLGVDVDSMSTVQLVKLVGFGLLPIAAVGFIGFFLQDIRRVYRIIAPAGIVVFAFIYSLLNGSVKSFEDFYKIKEQAGSYRDTYRTCQAMFDAHNSEEDQVA